MRWIQLDPPGTWCINTAFFSLISPLRKGQSFIEIGPGEGKLSRLLCDRGLTGTGIDFSEISIAKLSDVIRDYCDSGQYAIARVDYTRDAFSRKADLVFCMMVLEHIQDDVKFLQKMKVATNPGGKTLVCVPARMDKWGIEDELYGHYQRYERDALHELFVQAGFSNIRVWSITAPVANLLFGLSNLAIRKGSGAQRKGLSKQEQTKLSALKDVPCKTMFPSPFKLMLNRFTMIPFTQMQRLFYRSNFGLALIACGEVGSRAE